MKTDMKTGSIKDILVPVQVVLGEKMLRLEDITIIGPGTIIELNSMAGEPVDLVAAGEKIAREKRCSNKGKKGNHKKKR